MFKKTIFIILIILVSGLSGIVADHYLFPYLASTDFFQRHQWLKQSAENTTIINRTDQVYVKEASSVAQLMSPVDSSIVNIVSYPNSAAKTKNQAAPDLETQAKNGTGEIVTSDGLIMTYAAAIDYDQSQNTQNNSGGSSANNVGNTVAPAYAYKVLTSDGNTYDATLQSVDSWSNLAFLKISASNLPVVSFGNFSDYQAGEKVIAIGNDYPDYENRFDSGILNSFDPTENISGQALNVPEKLEGVFRTDFAAENPPVGGPIVDYSGQIVGIIGSVQSNGQTEYFEIPTDKVQAVLNKEIQKELTTNPTLGLYYLPVTKTLSLAGNLNVDHGALIYSSLGQQGLAVLAGSPAQKAGLELGDIITQVDGNDVTLSNNLSAQLYAHKTGDKIKLNVIRAGKNMEVDVQL
jgi:S1-C subfamily serine protease